MFRHQRFLLLILLCGISLVGHGQSKDFEYIAPVEITPLLAGNYGELRPNHFHGGVDIKTGGREGLNILAVADGHVSRIKISPWGYGKAVYIDHPEGYTTVYGHLRSLSPKLEAFVREHQYTQESFEVDVYPGSEDLMVKQGEIIALSGNTGGSGGPHLHFEIRATDSEIPLNPLVLDFPIEDHKKPIIQSIGIAPIGESTVNGRSKTVHARVSGSNVSISQPISVSGSFGIEVAGYDSQDGTSNRNGIYRIRLLVDDDLVSTFTADSIPFDKSRQLNALVDYSYYYKSRIRYLRLYRLPGNELPNLDYKDFGHLDLSEGIHELRVIAEDVHGNSSSCSFSITASENESVSVNNIVDEIQWNQPYIHETGSARVFLPAHCIYENLPKDIDELEMDQPAVQIFKPEIPAEKPFTVELKGKVEQGEQWLVCQVSSTGKVIRALPTSRDGSWFRAESKYFGIYTLVQDDAKPTITNINISNGSTWSDGVMKVKVKDNLSGIHRYDAYVDGEWILMEYEAKQDLLFINASELPAKNESQTLTIKVSDLAGNEAILTRSYSKKP